MFQDVSRCFISCCIPGWTSGFFTHTYPQDAAVLWCRCPHEAGVCREGRVPGDVMASPRADQGKEPIVQMCMVRWCEMMWDVPDVLSWSLLYILEIFKSWDFLKSGLPHQWQEEHKLLHWIVVKAEVRIDRPQENNKIKRWRNCTDFHQFNQILALPTWL